MMEKIEPVGPRFLAHARRQLFNRSFSEDETHQAISEAEAAAAVWGDRVVRTPAKQVDA